MDRKNRITISVSLDQEHVDRLNKIAEIADCPRSFVIRRLIESASLPNTPVVFSDNNRAPATQM